MPLQYAALAAARGATPGGPIRTSSTPTSPPRSRPDCRLDGAAVARADALSRRIAGAAAAFFAAGQDLLLSLTTPCPAWPYSRLDPAEIGGLPARPRDHAALTPLVNHAFLPAVTLPCGETADGLPLGLQIIGPRFSDDLVLRAAAAVAPHFAAP